MNGAFSDRTLESEFIAIGCNRTPGAFKWTRCQNLAVFAANNLVALFDPIDELHSGVKKTLIGHSSRINCLDIVYSIENPYQVIGIVSGGSYGEIIYWHCSDLEKLVFESTVWKGHSEGVSAIATCSIPCYYDGKYRIATASSDHSIKIWSVENNGVMVQHNEPSQVLHSGKHFVLSLAMTHCSLSNDPILAFAGSDMIIEVLVYQKETDQFVPAFKLSGHENWIRSLSFAKFGTSELYLASSSQDKYVRLWNIQARCGKQLDEAEGHEEKVERVANLKAKAITWLNLSSEIQYKVTLEALLMGHDDWVYSAHWCPSLIQLEKGNGSPFKYISGGLNWFNQFKTLVTASSDGLMLLWEFDAESRAWNNKVSVGDLNDSFGYYGAELSMDRKSIIGHGHTGSFHRWSDLPDQGWVASFSITGHFGSVEALSWDPKGSYFASVSADQTTRIFAPWIRPSSQESNALMSSWHEIGRPQIHGYNMQCISFIRPSQFISAGDEKVLRVFEAPQDFLELRAVLANLTSSDVILERESSSVRTAGVAPLGLTNKPSSVSEISTFGDNFSNIFPPTEAVLNRHCLWPEVEKLYGHAYEIFALASSPDGRFVAATCKSSTFEYAGIRVWRTVDWKQCNSSPYLAQSLTVTKVVFSPCSKFLISVSRDRSWALFEAISKENSEHFELVYHFASAHSRIIWTVAWSSDSLFFITGSRDKKLKLWSRASKSEIASVELPCSITALERCPFIPLVTSSHHNGSFEILDFFFVGLENGLILLIKIVFAQTDSDLKNSSLEVVYEFPKSMCHGGLVNDLKSVIALDLSGRSTSQLKVYLASCGGDFAVRLFSITQIPQV